MRYGVMREIRQGFDALPPPEDVQQFGRGLSGREIAVDLFQKVAVCDSAGLIRTQNLDE
jgi:hypothetical protein